MLVTVAKSADFSSEIALRFPISLSTLLAPVLSVF